MADKLKAFTEHPRDFRNNYYVYPVLSRRSQGLSIGINLNPEKDCNFKCIYCQVDRRTGRETFPDGNPLNNNIDLKRLEAELFAMLDLVASGEIWTLPGFKEAPAKLQRLNDIALSGDGEPTTSPYFADALEIIIGGMNALPSEIESPAIVVISNATQLLAPDLQASFKKLYANGGQIWAKLDAGDTTRLTKVAAVQVDIEKLKSDLIEFSKQYPIAIQSCLFARTTEKGDTESFELASYVQSICELIKAGGQVQWVQIYTLARSTKIASLVALSEKRLQEIKNELAKAIAVQNLALPRLEIYP